MKNINFIKILIVLSVLLVSLNAAATVVTDTFEQERLQGDIDFEIKKRLPSPRALIPNSLKGQIRKDITTNRQEKITSIECGVNLLCASFDVNTTPSDVSAWMGFEFTDDTGKYFIATYGQKTKYIGNRTYSTPKWDKKHFWIHIGEKTVPFPIQPRFVGKDIDSINEWYTVDYVGYRRKGIDYSKYWENMSQSALIFLIDPKTKKILKYHLEYYDENDMYVGDFDIEIGDKLESYFLGFKKGQEDTQYFFALEGITTVTKQVTFTYEELYPNKDFNSTYGKDLNFTKKEFKYIFEAYGKTRSNFTDPKPIQAKKITNDKNITSSTKTNTTPNKSASKSAPLSIFWSFLFIIMLINIRSNKNEKYI